MGASDSPSTLNDYLAVLRRRRWYLLTIIPAALLLSIYLAYALEPSYRASATILLEPSSIPTQIVQTTVMSYAEQQIEIVQRLVMTTDRLEELVKEIDPYPDDTEMTVRDKARGIRQDTLFERVDPITLEVLTTSNAFSIHYHNADPERAAQIAHNRKARGALAAETYDFLLAQSKDVERRIEESEHLIEKFKSQYGAALPESQGMNQAAVERLDLDLRANESRIRDAEQRQALLNIQLSQLNPTLAGSSGNWRRIIRT
jgi:hypothetical protein